MISGLTGSSHKGWRQARGGKLLNSSQYAATTVPGTLPNSDPHFGKVWLENCLAPSPIRATSEFEQSPTIGRANSMT